MLQRSRSYEHPPANRFTPAPGRLELAAPAVLPVIRAKVAPVVVLMTGPYPFGVDLIAVGECPKGATSPIACLFCSTGHMLECHYPMTCSQAQCSHLARYEEG
jgi:hypothetical protein